MTRPCMTYQSMSVTLMSICLIIITITSPLMSWPLRHLGREKKVTKHVAESRDLILCWVVQIMTNSRCNCALGKDSTVVDGDVELKNTLNDNSTSRDTNLQHSNCICEQNQIEEHISALSDEVGLKLLHTFERFHDHFLLCHLDIRETDRTLQRNPRIETSKSQSISRIHSLHSNLKFKDKVLFDKHKEDVEEVLRQHEEVLWFSSEFVHRHHSRSIVPPKFDFEKLEQEKSRLSAEIHIANTATYTLTNPKVDSTNESFSPENLETDSQDIIPSNTEDSVHSVIRSLWSRNTSHVYYGSRSDQALFRQAATQMLHSQDQRTESAGTGIYNQVFPEKSFHSVSRRSLDISFNDPKYPKQWHLNNIMTSGMDINVTGVWRHNYTGRGVTVAVVDDGLEWMNPDIKANYNYKGSWDMNDNDPDPSPNTSKFSNHHGTRCAGEIAAVANNNVCGVGVAYEAQIAGIRVLDGLMTDSMEAEAFNKKMDVNDIYSCSWGPDDDGRTVDGPHLMAAKAMKYGVDFGRRGFGSIFVLASGNGGENQDNCNFDGYANSIYTVTIGAVDDKGGMPYYAEECASMLGVTFSSGAAKERDIVTTDWTMGNTNGCTESHTGTSAAAPLAAGMIALMLEARPCLTWRDVQYIIILTGQTVDVAFAHSQTNGAGLSHSHKHGFGLLNSWRLVNAARRWKIVPWLTSYSYAESNLNLIVPKGKSMSLKLNHIVSEADIQGLSLFILENVQLTMTMSHPCRGKIGITLTSPAGTVSILATPRPKDNSTDGFSDWTFTSVRCWGEKPTGTWKFSVTDYDDLLFGQGEVTKWRLTLFGTPMTSEEFVERQKEVQSSMSGEFLAAKPLPCPPAPQYEKSYFPLSDRTLKILILSGSFCLIMAVYETLEYMFCYNDEKQETSRSRLSALSNHQQEDAADDIDHIGHRLLNGIAPSLNYNNTSSNGVDDDDDDDIFNASETSTLLRDGRMGRSDARLNFLTPEEIPMPTFSIAIGESSVSDYLPLPREPDRANDGDVTTHLHPDGEVADSMKTHFDN